MALTNWAGNYTYGAARLHRPTTVEEIQSIVAAANKVKALGTRHSFSAIADTEGDLIALEHLNRIVSLDPDRRTVTVEGGITYGELCHQLNDRGFALHNLASLPHISVAGACCTATHGSGVRNGNLAKPVLRLEVVKADGMLVAFSRDHVPESPSPYPLPPPGTNIRQEEGGLPGAVVCLGGLGIVVRLTLEIVPSFEMKQEVYENLPLLQLEQHFDEIMASGYSVSLFTDWQSQAINQVWVKSLVRTGGDRELASSLFGATPATRRLHPLARKSPENCTEQMGIPGPWHERLPHFRLEYTPSSGEELQSEYFVRRRHGFSAMWAIAELREQLAPVLQISEVRIIAGDSLWMSPCYKRDSIAIHFTWKKDWEGVRRILPVVEERLAPFRARPHWGKLFTMSPHRLQSLYPKLPDFQRLLKAYDPEGKFRNEFLDQLLLACEVRRRGRPRKRSTSA